MASAGRILPIVINFLLQAVLTAVLCLFAVSLTIGRLHSFQFALLAASMDVISLCCFTWAMLWILCRPQYSRRKFMDQSKGFLTIMVLPAIAYTMTALFLVMLQFKISSSAGNNLTKKMLIGEAGYYLLYVAWGLLAASVLATAFVIVNFRMDHPLVASSQDESLPRYTIARISPTWTPPSPLSFHEVGIVVPPLSPYMDSCNDSSISTPIHDSFHSTPPYGVGSISSRTGLAPTPSFPNSAANNSSSPEHVGRDFNTPFSSPVSPLGFIEHKPRIASNNISIQRLEPIPDSQYYTSMKTLAWPPSVKTAVCGVLVSDEDTESLPRSPIFHDQTGEKGCRVRLLRDGPEPSPTTPSRATLDESHIHPLFRTDSPQPPPTPTASSSVTASAFGGRFITSTGLARVRAQSVPSPGKGVALQTLPANTKTQTNFTGKAKVDKTDRVIVRSKSLEAAKSGLGIINETENVPPIPPLPPQRLSGDTTD